MDERLTGIYTKAKSEKGLLIEYGSHTYFVPTPLVQVDTESTTDEVGAVMEQ